METPDRLVIAIVQIDDVHDLVPRLVEQGFGATRIDAAGGFLRKENALILVAVASDRLQALMAVLRQTCRTRTATWLPTIDDGTVGLYAEPIEVEVGGAVIFVIPIERIEFLGADPVAAAAAAARKRGAGG